MTRKTTLPHPILNWSETMSKFTSEFWEWFIFVPTVLGLVGLIALIVWMSKRSDVTPGKPETMGHEWDGLEEYNNPLPGWWLVLFLLTIAFAVVYLMLYPGLGITDGALGWSSKKVLQQQQLEQEEKLSAFYQKYGKIPVTELAKNTRLMRTGARLFGNNCATCHGARAEGAKGYPNLRDKDWLFGDTPQAIEKTILDGRFSVLMQAWLPKLKAQGVDQLTEYVLSLSGRKHDQAKAAAGKNLYMANCVGCHGPQGKGMQALGAPNLTDNIWLHGGSRKDIYTSIAHGRKSTMPAHRKKLGEAKVRILAAYIYSLSHDVHDKQSKEKPAR